jgi:hypothetical protein
MDTRAGGKRCHSTDCRRESGVMEQIVACASVVYSTGLKNHSEVNTFPEFEHLTCSRGEVHYFRRTGRK